ncbi:MAG: hypothetical protein MUC96_06145 [Myxococcaceae bacterium]|nr:hypothetical protein [Myxococcaceae bacterium]
MTGAGDPRQREESLELFDYALIRDVVGFVFRGIRRHRVLAAVSFVGVFALGAAGSALVPRTWHAEARLLANQNEIIRALGNPRSSLPSEDPTRAARELIFAHDNLVSLIKQTNLLKAWEEHRPPVVRLKDLLVRAVSGPLSEEDRVDAMVGTLEKRLHVVTDAQTVTISVDWQDPQTAYLLVETAQQNFLETRHVTEMTAISEALAILETHASQVQKTVDDTLHELERVREERRKGGSGASPAAATGENAPVAVTAPPEAVEAPNAPPPATEPELAQLKYLLNSKKRALADLEDFRSRRLQELNAQLQEFRVQYADQHPVVIDAQQRIDQMKLDSPQMLQVKQDIEQLNAEYQRKGGRAPESLVEPSRSAVRPAPRRQQTQAALSLSELADDPLVEHARNNLRVAAAKYEELMMRIDGARIEQDTARAAFKYRYSVVRPASVPKKPQSPNAAVLLGGAFAFAVLAALLIGALRDVRSGTLVEPWQVSRRLGLPVLSQVRLP